MSSCVFCMIVKKEMPASIVYEDDQVIAFLDINPVQTGHTLVIPKNHFVDIWDTDPAVFTKVVDVVRQVSKKMAATLKVEGINIFSASGRSAGQEVFHFHMHVIPLGRGERTKFADWWSSKTTKAERSDLERLALRLRV